MSAKPSVEEGDWVCAGSECENVNFARRTSCNLCGLDKPEADDAAAKSKALGTEIGKVAAEKSRGLFSADDWQCGRCGNVNWARRGTCNVCNTAKFGENEERTGLGGGYNDRGQVEYKARDDSDGEYDDFGRRKKKVKASNNKATAVEAEPDYDDLPTTSLQPSAAIEAEEEEEDDDDGDISKYKLDSDSDGDEAVNGATNNSVKAKEEKNAKSDKGQLISTGADKSTGRGRARSSRSRSKSRNRTSRSSSHISKESRSRRSRSRSRNRSDRHGSRSRSPAGHRRRRSRSRSYGGGDNKSKGSRSKSRDRHRRSRSSSSSRRRSRSPRSSRRRSRSPRSPRRDSSGHHHHRKESSSRHDSSLRRRHR